MIARTAFLLFILILFFVLVQVDLLVLAFVKIGIPPRYVFTALFATLAGSLINIPVKKIPQETMTTDLLTLIAFRMARPLPGVGIVLPFFVPPLLAALVSVALSYEHAPVIAYIAGSMGTLIGADILHLGEIKALGTPIASIGGAGTFDGIFLNGILAVLLSTFLM